MADARPRSTDGLRENGSAREQRVEYTKPARAEPGGNRANAGAAVKPKYQDAALVEAFADLVDPVPTIPTVRGVPSTLPARCHRPHEHGCRVSLHRVR